MRLLSIALTLAAAAAAGAQTAPRRLGLVIDRRIDIKIAGNARDVLLAVGPKGQIAATMRYTWQGISVFDSTGKAYPWRLQTGRGDSSEIGAPMAINWVGQSDTMWVADASFDGQIVLVGPNGNVFKSLEKPTWIHPSWAERRKFPVFGRMDLLAVGSDQTMLIIPSRPKSLLDTPGYDRSSTQILRATWDGAIRGSVAKLPSSNRAVELNANGCRHVIQVPFAAPALWAISPDGSRIAMISTVGANGDSGAVRLTMLNEKSETVFARDLPITLERVQQQKVDEFLNGINACGKFTGDQLRDSVRSRVAKFTSSVSGVMVGRDQSTWVLLRNPAMPTERDALIIDAKGDVVGQVALQQNETPLAVARDYYWSFEPGKQRASTLVRFRVDPNAKAAPPPRTAPASASSKSSRPPE
jgi:hypothetical protein